MSNQDPEVQLQQLEARLRNAIRSRDAYLTTLAQDQRLEMPSKFQRRTRSAAPHNRRRRGSNRHNQKQQFQVFHSESRERGANLAAPKDNLEEDFADSSATVRPPPLLSRLETSALFWGTQRQFGQKGQNDLSAAVEPLRPLGARIPENYGILLESDVPAMDEQLAQIRQSLAQLKQFRLSGPTSDYFRSVRPQSSHNPRLSTEEPVGISRLLPSPSMVQIRTRLLNLEWHIEGRVRELLDKHHKPMKLEPRGTVSWQSDVIGNESWHPIAPSETLLAQNEQREMAQRIPSSVPYQRQQTTVPEQPPMFPEVQRHQQTMMEGQEQQAPNQQLIFQEPIVRSTAQIVAQKDTVERSTFEFEPMRQIVFGTTMETTKIEDGNQQKAELEPKGGLGAETTLAEPAEPVVPPKREDDDVNFQRMLDVLKNPRKFDLSSSTSSSPSSPEPPVNKAMDTKVTTPPRDIGDQLNFGGGIRSTQMYVATSKDKEGDSDSSDSFFK